jgi:hypothetical protein
LKFISQLIGAHRARYPDMTLADVYKLLHQAALGPAHAVDLATARARLLEELASLGSGPVEPLVDPISPDGRLARVHLRTWAARALPAERLAEAFVATAGSWPADAAKLARFCGCLGDLADAGGVPATRAEVEAFVTRCEREGWPALHHSAAFRSAHAPAYRVVDVSLLPPGVA